MITRRMVAVFAACAAFLGAVSATPAAAAADLPACAATPELSTVVQHERPGRWLYTFQVAWCVENGAIRWIEPVLGYQVLDADCAFVGNMEESETRKGDDLWHVFNMSAFWCVDPDGSETTDYPWAVIGIRLDGSSDVVGKGVD
jgi:hypothetical protein